MFRIFPEPKQCTFSGGVLSVSCLRECSIAPELKAACQTAGFDPVSALSTIFPGPVSPDGVSISAEYCAMTPESFRLTIGSDRITITSGDGAGLFYALGVLRQLAGQADGLLPLAEIADAPALSVRGIMLDIGRDKIPSMETAKALIDLFAAMRINHLQLYMEGFSFDYEQYHYLFTNETPVTPAQMQELSQYAKARFIDLVPNQNVLGHMEKWLEKPQFRGLAECEDGYIFENLFWRPPMTLDPRDERSFDLAKTLLGTLMDTCDSEYINVNMDEPFELGMGKNREAALQEGRLSLYFEYVEKLNEYCASHGRKMMMWGDEVLHHPGCVSRFPKNVTLLDWIYEGDAHFEDHAKLMQETGLSYCLCPGTSSWGSLTGRSDNMAKNIRDAASCAIRFGGRGIITTDWGDLGHWQYLSVSYPGFAYTAACSWSGPKSDAALIEWYCNHFIYKSPKENAFRAAWDLGNYYHLEHAPLYNTTLAFAVISSKYTFDSIEEFDAKMKRLLTLSANIARTNSIPPQEPAIRIDFEAMKEYLARVEAEIAAVSMTGPDADLIRAEMKNGLRMVRHGIRLYHAMTMLRGDQAAFSREMEALFYDLDEILKIHYNLWTARNRVGGFQRSTTHMNELLFFYKKMQQTEISQETKSSCSKSE